MHFIHFIFLINTAIYTPSSLYLVSLLPWTDHIPGPADSLEKSQSFLFWRLLLRDRDEMGK